MKNTVEITIAITNNAIREELIAQLSLLNYDAFEEKDNELVAFINETDFNADSLDMLVARYKLTYSKKIIEDQNWNALWESNFDPVIVDDFCAIRADFHPPFTDKKHEIIITPKMSFGTGHHATTYMMISEMSKLDLANKEVADFGTGTGVLAILAEKSGSRSVWAIDIDEWSIENAKENIEKNGCKHIVVEKRESFDAAQKFDIVLANINKNVILSNVSGLLFGLKSGGQLLLSGLLKEDETDIVTAFTSVGLAHISTVERNRWICISLKMNGVNKQ